MAPQHGKARSTLRAPHVSPLEAHLGYWLRFVSSHVSHRLRQKVKQHGVTVAEWVVLRELYRQGTTSPGELAHCLRLTKGTVSKLIDRLCVKALVTRDSLTPGGRRHCVALSGVGRALVPTLASLADENDAELFRHLPPGRRELIAEALKEVVRVHRLKPLSPD